MRTRDDDILTKTALARELGVSQGRVSQYIRRGLPVLADGHLSRSDALAWLHDHLDRSRIAPATAAALSRASPPTRQAPPPNGRPGTSAEPISLEDARTAREIANAALARIRVEKLRGELVERDKATALVFRLFRELRDAWIGWPARIAAELAAELGVDTLALQQALEARVRAELEARAEPRLDLH